MLKTGDTLHGTILSKKDGSLAIATDFAGEITISWDRIKSFSSQAPLTILLDDQTLLEGIASSSPDGDGGIYIDEADTPIALGRIVHINPPPHISGKGISWKGRFNGSLAMTDGNTNSQNLHADTEFIARTKKNRYTAGGQYKMAKDEGSETVSNLAGFCKYDRFVTKKLYGSANGLFEKDRFQDLNLRTTVGVGIGYQIFETSSENFSVEAGVSYVKEDFIVAENDEFPAGRWAASYDRFVLGETLQLFHNHMLLIGLENSEDLLLRSRTGVRVPAYKKLYITMQVNYDWDNTPAEGKERSDTTYLLGLGYTL